MPARRAVWMGIRWMGVGSVVYVVKALDWVAVRPWVVLLWLMGPFWFVHAYGLHSLYAYAIGEEDPN